MPTRSRARDKENATPETSTRLKKPKPRKLTKKATPPVAEEPEIRSKLTFSSKYIAKNWPEAQVFV